METQIIEKSNPIYILARSDENNNITYFHGLENHHSERISEFESQALRYTVLKTTFVRGLQNV